MKRDIPAPGYQLVSGKRAPPADWQKVWVQLRNGWCDMHGPWPVAGTVWKHDGGAGDIVAVKRADAPQKADGRQENGSYE